MAWVKLDNGFREHRKVLRATPAGVCLWVCGLDYCNRQPARDGFIPAEVVRVLYPMPQPMKVAKRLVEVGLWEAEEGGFRVHDYHVYQPSADSTEGLREKRAEAGRRGGQRSGEVRRSKAEANSEADGKQNASGLPRSNEAKTKPVPVPVPEEDLNPIPVSGSVADAPDPGPSPNATGSERGTSEPASVAELQQRFVDARNATGEPLIDPTAEWEKFRRYYAKRPPGPEANWHALVDAWLRNIAEKGFCEAGERRRGPRRVARPTGELTSLGDVLRTALGKKAEGE
jgi:hypothetical protein